MATPKLLYLWEELSRYERAVLVLGHKLWPVGGKKEVRDRRRIRFCHLKCVFAEQEVGELFALIFAFLRISPPNMLDNWRKTTDAMICWRVFRECGRTEGKTETLYILGV